MPFKLYLYLGAFVTYCDPIVVISIMPISTPNLKFDPLLESPNQNYSNKWSNKDLVKKFYYEYEKSSVLYVEYENSYDQNTDNHAVLTRTQWYKHFN